MTMRLIHPGFLVVAAFAVATMACNREVPPPTPIDETAVSASDDERVATYVQARFQADSSVRASDIQVSADNGVVTLRGRVPNQNVREHAVQLARQVNGVNEVKDDLQIQSDTAADAGGAMSRPVEGGRAADQQADASRSPAWITTKIQAQYFVNPEVKPWNVDVTTHADGTVTLEGEVEEAADSREAERIARETEGVTRVENRLRVQSATATAERADRDAVGEREAAERATRSIDNPDEWVTAKIQAKYFMDMDVKGRNINVDTRDGVVTLRGEVESDSERRQAVAIARNTDGVQTVTDQLTVQPAKATGTDERRSDALTVEDVWITTKVQSQFFLDPDIKGRDINVDTRDGVVVLTGTVETEAERKEAEAIARDTDGVTRIDNQLKVDTASGRR